jgi:hypothetical protein
VAGKTQAPTRAHGAAKAPSAFKRPITAKAGKAGRSTKAPQAPAADSGDLRPFLRFYHSAALRTKTLELLHAIETAADPTVHRAALAELVIELTDNGLDYCFVQPLMLSKPGFVVEQSARLGLVGVQQVFGSVARKIIGHMGGPQLISVCGSIRRFMR